MYMKKAYTFRLDPNLIKKLDSFDGNRTYNVDLAIQSYVQDGFNSSYNCNTEVVQILKDQLMDLKNDKNILQDRLDYFMLPSYKRFFLKKP